MNAASHWLTALSVQIEPIKTTKANQSNREPRGPRPTVKPLAHKERIATRICNQMYGQTPVPPELEILQRLKDEASMSKRIGEEFLKSYKSNNNL